MKLNKLKQRWELWKLRWRVRLFDRKLCPVHFAEKGVFWWPPAVEGGRHVQRSVRGCQMCHAAKELEKRIAEDGRKFRRQALIERGQQLRQNLGL